MKKGVLRLGLGLIFVVLCVMVFIFILCKMPFSNGLKPSRCVLSDEYLEWDKLSIEEKKEVNMPFMCKSVEKKKDSSFGSEIYLPSKYDLRNEKISPMVKNQMSTNSCWAFSSISSLESYLLKNKIDNNKYSPRHLDYYSSRYFLNNKINNDGYDRKVGSGGNFYMSSNYFLSSYGPVLEKDMPFINSEGVININEINKETRLDVDEVNMIINDKGKCSSDSIKEIKYQVYNYGAIASSVYLNESDKSFNSSKSSLNYTGGNLVNHSVTIIGWDDSYSRYNFKNVPKSEGAFIVQNSYGTNWGDKGYFYVSYEDVRICNLLMGIMDVSKEVEDNTYSLDKLGINSSYGYKEKVAYAANVFSKEVGKKEELKEVSFASLDTGKYEVYYVLGNVTKVNKVMRLIGSGNIVHKGYTTVKLKEKIILDEDVSDFTIIVKYMMDNSIYPVATMDVSSNPWYKSIKLEKEKSFISYNGWSWYDMYNASLVAGIKAYTNDINYIKDISLDSIKNNGNKTNLKIKVDSKRVIESNLSIKFIDSSNKEIPIDFKYIFDEDNLNYIDISTNRLDVGKYTLILEVRGSDTSKRLNINISNKIVSDKYKVDEVKKYIYSYDGVISYDTFKKSLSNYDIVVKEGSSVLTSGNMKTGLKVIVGSTTYTFILVGDVTGDGFIKMNDVMKISKYVVENTGLSGINLLASDVVSDDRVKMNDVMKVSKYIVSGGSLK